MGWGYSALLLAALGLSDAVAAQTATATFRSVEYEAQHEVAAPPGQFRNPVLPGFHPDPSITRVGDSFYLATSTFGWWPALPVYRSTDLVNWTLVSHAVSRAGLLDLSDSRVATDGIYAPAISWHDGKFIILGTCVRCGGNFFVTAPDAAGPWSDPVWLDFEGIDPSLFVDEDGAAYVLNNGAPVGQPRYDGHRAIWIQRIDLASGQMVGARTVLVDGGVNPADQPIWAEGPHIYRHDGWYYLTAAEGGTADQHSQTIYRSRDVTGPYVPGPRNPILTQRDLPADRAERVEATGHADLVQLDDGTWWGTFLATRPFAGQSTLLGRETWLLPVRWQDGWPTFLDSGEPVPFNVPRPALAEGEGTDWSRWAETFTGPDLSGEWLRIRNPAGADRFALAPGGGLELALGDEPAGGAGQPGFLGRRLRHPAARITTTMRFTPERAGDFAGLLALIDEDHFLAFGLEQGEHGQMLALRTRRSADESERGTLMAAIPASDAQEIELRLEIDLGTANLAWRPAGGGDWRAFLNGIDAEYMASVHAGLFTGLLVGPYAVSGAP